MFMQWLGRVSPKRVDDIAAKMAAAWNLAVGVIRCHAAGEAQPFRLEAQRQMHQPEVGIGIARHGVELDAKLGQPAPKLILKVELLVAPALALDQRSPADRCVAFDKHINDRH